eukprot:jgi/Phyca11/106646/e_gw1.12.668.1
MLNEARVVLVMSWLDLVSRIIFSLGVVSTTADMKELLFGRFSRYTSTGFRTRWGLLTLQFSHYAFAVWGVVILSLHIHASMQTPLFECTPKVYPMAGALPSCYTVRLDCYLMGITGLKQE